MFTLATDVQKIIMEFLEPQEIKVLYETCKETKVMFDELTKHTNFIVDCKRIFLNKEIKWFKLKNIKLKLLETYYLSISGNQYWCQNGERHRDNDLPAEIYYNGDLFWCQNGERHRDNDLPAAIYTSGDQLWYKNGKFHRDNDLPAIICYNGTQYWYQNGLQHRDNGPAIIYSDGTQHWYKNGKCIR